MVLRRIALLLGGLLLALGLAELLARTMAPIPAEELLFGAPDRSPAGLYRPDGTLFLSPTPGFRGAIGPVELRINGLGTRGPEPGPGPHWLAVGDSFTMAVQVGEAEHFTTKLGAALGVELLNGGVDGYSTGQALLRYQQLAERVALDGVLLLFFLGNDLTDNQRWPNIQATLDPRHPPPIPARETPPAWRSLLDGHSRAWGWARVATRRGAIPEADRKRFAEELSIFTHGGRARLDDALRMSEAPLAGLRDEAARRGDRVMVAVAPPSFVFDPARAAATLETFGLEGPEVDAPRRGLLALLQRLGLPACDLQPALAAAWDSDPYLRFDGHWTAAGHAVVAGAMADCLR